MISYALAFHLKALTFSHDHYYSADQKIRGKIIIDHKSGEEKPSIGPFSFKYFEI